MDGPYRRCDACNGMCFTGFDANNRPIACRDCNATGRLYTGGKR
jgi:hypothetical protein